MTLHLNYYLFIFLNDKAHKMIRFLIQLATGLLCGVVLPAQDNIIKEPDSVKAKQLEEVVIISQKAAMEKTAKPLATLDNYLEKAGSINMIRRGIYAWEPYLNGMASERSVVTIDGMRIYAACTDKMDPVTSYVEITNLARANIHSGQTGSLGGSTVAGSLDLVRSKSFFGERLLKGAAFTGFETNNQQKIAGTQLSYSSPKIFTDIDFTYRSAKNYKAGGGEEVLYSQFLKYNMSATAGYNINGHQYIEASLIYDRAVNVGYPALPMDVSLAKALIGSVEYVRLHLSPHIHKWETKLYYNEVTHIMDDTKRPVVPIRMDMPGWSKTAGFYSKLEAEMGKHNLKANLSAHHNQSLAEMTMFSNTPGERDMFMLTWPGVHTNYADVFIEDAYALSQRLSVILSAGLGVHNNVVDNQFGYESMKIFYADMAKSKTRLLKRAAASFQFENEHWSYSIGMGYGERAPSVSEGYGFYLFNSFDRFDYIGNPGMKNEKSASLNGALQYKQKGFSAKLSANWFYITNYIIGRPDNSLSVMTIGAAGVKIYEQLKYANIINTSIDLNYQFNKNWLWSNRLGYRRGTAYKVNNLPLIQPFSYNSSIAYSLKSFSTDISINGAAKQQRFNPLFGEKMLPAYAIANLSASYRFKLKKNLLTLKSGVENIFDKNYTTFADWNRLPRMGRNIFVNLVWNF